jgi:hypothetical protein
MRIVGAAASMVQLQMQHQAIAAERQILLQTHANLCEFRLRRGRLRRQQRRRRRCRCTRLTLSSSVLVKMIIARWACLPILCFNNRAAADGAGGADARRSSPASSESAAAAAFLRGNGRRTTTRFTLQVSGRNKGISCQAANYEAGCDCCKAAGDRGSGSKVRL